MWCFLLIRCRQETILSWDIKRFPGWTPPHDERGICTDVKRHGEVAIGANVVKPEGCTALHCVNNNDKGMC